jgi:regulator of sigma E protease
LGGVIVNVITGVVIFIALTFSNGNNFISKDELNKNGIVALELGKQIGLQTGDKVVRVNGADYKSLADLRTSDVLLGENSSKPCCGMDKKTYLKFQRILSKN